jgi:hypothetical protein
MAESRLVIRLPNGQSVSLAGVLEDDESISLQVADLPSRQALADIREAFLGTVNELAAAAAALEVAANAEHASTQVILANVGSLIASAQAVDTASDQLVATLAATIQSLADTQPLVLMAAQSMQASFGSLEDVRTLVQALLNNMAEVLSGSIPSIVPVDPLGAPRYGDVSAVAGHTWTTVASFTVGAGLNYVLSGFTGTGSAEGRWRLQIGAATVLPARSGPGDRTATAHFPPRGLPQAPAGTLVRVQVQHPEAAPADFEATIHGYFLPS